MGDIDLTVVVPAYNEIESIGELYSIMTAELEGLGRSYEIIFVDDGSTDGGKDVLRTLRGIDSRVGAIFLEKNFGQSAALSAGFDRSRGNFIVTLDSDLQNNPADIKPLLKCLEGGYDVVVGWRYERADPLLSKRIPATISNAIIRCLTGVRVHDCGCSLKVFRGEVARSLSLTKGMHRFIPVIMRQRGFKVGELKVSHRMRRYGRSKYSIWRIPRAFMDFIILVFRPSLVDHRPASQGGFGRDYVISEVL